MMTLQEYNRIFELLSQLEKSTAIVELEELLKDKLYKPYEIPQELLEKIAKSHEQYPIIQFENVECRFVEQDGTLDEIVSDNTSVHLERMDDNCYWLRIGTVAAFIGPSETQGRIEAYWHCAEADEEQSKELEKRYPTYR